MTSREDKRDREMIASLRDLLGRYPYPNANIERWMALEKWTEEKLRETPSAIEPSAARALEAVRMVLENPSTEQAKRSALNMVREVLGLPRTLSEFVHASPEVRESVGTEVVAGAIERQRSHVATFPTQGEAFAIARMVVRDFELPGTQRKHYEADAVLALAEALLRTAPANVAPRTVDILFDGPPDHHAPRFVEVESPPGTSIRFGEWVQRENGYWALRFTEHTSSPSGEVLPRGQAGSPAGSSRNGDEQGAPSSTRRMTANRRWMLGNAFWRMFEHGRKNNTVSAQCEVQALDMFLDGQDMPAWKTGDPARTPLSATYTRNTPEDPKRG